LQAVYQAYDLLDELMCDWAFSGSHLVGLIDVDLAAVAAKTDIDVDLLAHGKGPNNTGARTILFLIRDGDPMCGGS
jgi:hypothetical protein